MELRRFFQRRKEDAELARELQAHISHQVDENIATGMSADEALRQAHLKLGNPQRVREAVWDWNTVGFLDDLLRDLRYALRMLRRSPGFSALAVLCLTLGIGANAAVFSWIEGNVLRPYPAVADQDRLLVLAGTLRGSSEYDATSWPDFIDLRRSCVLLDSFIAEKIVGTTLSVGDRAEIAVGSLVSANYFDALGIHPALGRGFNADEDSGRNAHPVAVISYGLWQQRFHGDPEIIGKTQIFNGVTHTIVGVAPRDFYGTFIGYSWQFWVPVSMQEKFDSSGYKLEDRSARWIEGFVRLKPGVTRAQAQQEIDAAAQRLEKDFPSTNRGRGITLLPLSQSPFNNTKVLLPTLEITLAVVFFVLLIACANVSNLLLVRSFARRREITIRLAVGARRGRVLRQLLTEGVVLSVLGALGGLAVAYWCRNLLVLLFPRRGVPLYVPGHVDWRVLAISIGVCLASTLLFALVPALQTSRFDLAGALKTESSGVVGARGKARIRSGLVLLQVSLSFILLVGAGLVIQSLRSIRNTSPGFSTDQVLLTAVNLFAAGYDMPRAKNFQNQLMERVQSLSGVESAAYSRVAVFSYRTYSSASILVDGYEPAPDERPEVEYNEVGPDYLATLGIPLVSGREFTRADDESAAPVAIVNEAMAARYWNGGDPVGRRLKVNDRWLRVVGVAKMAKYSNMLEAAKPFFYVPLLQNPSAQVGLNVRTRLSPQAMETALAREVHALDANLALYEVTTLRVQVDQKNSSQRVAVTLLSVFGGLALLLAAIGLYGVMSYTVSQGTHEYGLRMALGARAADLLRLVFSQGLKLTLVGVVTGVVAALLLTRLIANFLYHVSPRDPLAYATAFAVMVVVAVAACFFPAWRASRIDPGKALRD
ncbi:MAG TPA: ABC transporter permease [Candidatus Angelobacter sp.]|nr:ABC transporter permease [Candidatus Angelobacter sp.]